MTVKKPLLTITSTLTITNNYQQHQISLGGLPPLEYRSLLAENG